MTVQYHAAPRYLGSGHKDQGGGPECQRGPIPTVDAWVVRSFWEALSPAELDRYDAAIAAVEDQRLQLRRARDLQLKRLRYEAGLAEKQYRLVDPENRLVAAELERRWEQALQALRRAEEEAQAPEPTIEPLTEELLRTLIDKVVLQRPHGDRCEVRMVWKGGDGTTAVLELRVVTYAEMADGEQLVCEVLRRTRAGQSDEQIAAEMTAAGYQAPLKKCLNVDSVVRIRHQHGVYSRKTEFLRHGLAGWITLGQAVERLGEHKSWAYYLIRKRRLLIHRDPEIGLYLVRDDERVLKELKELLRGERFSLTLERRSSGSAIVRRPLGPGRGVLPPGPPRRSSLPLRQPPQGSHQGPLL